MTTNNHVWDPNATTDPDQPSPYASAGAATAPLVDSFSFGDGASTPQAALKALSGPLRGRTISLGRLTTLGRRAGDNDISLKDHAVSSFHAKICRENGGYILYDLLSKNGTYVNEMPITTHELQDSDQIRIGQSLFSFNPTASLD